MTKVFFEASLYCWTLFVIGHTDMQNIPYYKSGSIKHVPYFVWLWCSVYKLDKCLILESVSIIQGVSDGRESTSISADWPSLIMLYMCEESIIHYHNSLLTIRDSSFKVWSFVSLIFAVLEYFLMNILAGTRYLHVKIFVLGECNATKIQALL